MSDSPSELDTRYPREERSLLISPLVSLGSHMHTRMIELLAKELVEGERGGRRGEGPGRRVTHLSGMRERCSVPLVAWPRSTLDIQMKTRTPRAGARALRTRSVSRKGNFYVPVRPDGSWFPWVPWVLGTSGTVDCCCPCTETAPPLITALDTTADRSHDSAIF